MFSTLLVAHSRNERKCRSLRLATLTTGLGLSVCNVKSDVSISSYFAFNFVAYEVRLAEKCGTQFYIRHKRLNMADN